MHHLLPYLEPFLDTHEYREPFLGGGSVYMAVAGRCKKGAWINDYDSAVALLWHTVRDQDRMRVLMELVRHAKQEQEKERTQAQKDILRLLDDWCLDPDFPAEDAVELSAAKLKIHAHSFGGCSQGSARPACEVDKQGRPKHRWSPSTIIPAMAAANYRMFLDNTRITNTQWEPLLEDKSKPALLYLDPPYVHAGRKCYDLGVIDHAKLADDLKACQHPWVLSYDDCDIVRDLYAWANIKSFTMKSTLSHAEGREAVRGEVIITPRTIQFTCGG